MATTIEIWPDNVRAFNLFQGLRTQWRVGMNGPVGLDFMVAYHRMDRMGLTPDDYAQMEQDLHIMEAAAINVMYEKK